MDYLKYIFEALKSPTLSATVGIASGFCFWGVPRVFPKQNIFIEKYETWILLAFAISVGSVLVSISKYLWGLVIGHRSKITFLNQLMSLTPDEQHVLLGYLENRTVTQYLDIQSGVVGSLMNKGLLYLGAKSGRYTTFAININPAVYDFLFVHPEVLSEPHPPDLPPIQKTMRRFR